MRPRTAAWLGVAILAQFLAVFGPQVAEARGAEPWPRMGLANTEVCVLPDFVVTGSGWRVHQAVANWNTTQPYVHLSTVATPGCAPVRVHRYADATDTRCGFTDYAAEWTLGTTDDQGVYRYPSADVWLNTSCTWTTCGSKALVGHELGHALGLDHTVGDPSSIMAQGDPMYQCREHHAMPNPANAAAVAGLYGVTP